MPFSFVLPRWDDNVMAFFHCFRPWVFASPWRVVCKPIIVDTSGLPWFHYCLSAVVLLTKACHCWVKQSGAFCSERTFVLAKHRWWLNKRQWKEERTCPDPQAQVTTGPWESSLWQEASFQAPPPYPAQPSAARKTHTQERGPASFCLNSQLGGLLF